MKHVKFGFLAAALCALLAPGARAAGSPTSDLVPLEEADPKAEVACTDCDRSDWTAWDVSMQWLWTNSLRSAGGKSRFETWTLGGRPARPRGAQASAVAELVRRVAGIPFSPAADGAAKAQVVHQKILAWFPSQPKGYRQLYLQRLSDGKERQVYEAEMGELREISRVRAVKTDPNNPMRKVAGFEVTYEDGSKKFIQQDPLVFDLSGRGVRTSERLVLYGLSGTSKRDILFRIQDVESGQGILVFDPDRDGESGETGLELFGDQSDVDGDGKPDGFAQGFEALNALVARAVHEGVLKPEVPLARRLDAKALRELERAYGLKMRVGGFNRKPVPLAEAGVAAIALSSEAVEWGREFDGQGDTISFQPGAVFLRPDGSAGSYANVWFTSK